MEENEEGKPEVDLMPYEHHPWPKSMFVVAVLMFISGCALLLL